MNIGTRQNIKDVERDRIVSAVRQYIVFSGWSLKNLGSAARDAGLGAGAEKHAFPQGITEAVIHYFNWGDRCMLTILDQYVTQTLRVEERIFLSVETRLSLLGGRELIQRTLPILIVPIPTPIGVHIAYHTVDSIWHFIGDKIVDASFYTRRVTLVIIYIATLLYWLNDLSENNTDTYRFLSRCLADVTQLGTVRSSVKRIIRTLPGFLYFEYLFK